MLNTPVPPQIAEIIARLEAAKTSNSVDENEAEQLVFLTNDAEEHLQLIAKLQYRGDKGFEREPPSYAFGPLNVQKAEQALSYVADLRSGLKQGDSRAVLKAAREIENRFREEH